MPDAEQNEPDGGPPAGGPVFSGYGVASTILALVAVVAVVLISLIWIDHHDDNDELAYRTDVLQAAADWTSVLINMNAQNVDASLQKLRDGTVGELNADFDATVQPFRQVVQTLQSNSTGQIQAVAVESVHHDLDTPPGAPPPASPAPLPPAVAARTDMVLVVATSVSANPATQPQTVHWNLRLGVSDVDGKLLISRLESMR
jgi:hypothetical protein